MHSKRIIRITTIPLSLQKLIGGQLPFMKAHGFEPTMVSADGQERVEVVEEQGSPHVVIDLSRKITPSQDLKALGQFYKLCRKLKPVIIHSHTPKAGLVGMIGGWLAGVPVRLHTVAGLPLMEKNGFTRMVLEQVEKLIYACATMVYPNSTNLKEFIIRSGFTRENKLKVVGNGSSNGIDTNFFRKDLLDQNQLFKLRNQLGIGEKDFVFVFIGRIVKDKGIQELVAAFSRLEKESPGCKLLLVGPQEQELDPLREGTLEEINRNPSILSVGYQKDVRPYLAISHALVFPSYREGFPNVPMQAGCFNLPSIVTDINGCNEIIVEGENGLIIPPKETEELLKAMKKLREDPILYERLASSARRMIVERYDQKHFWNLLLQEYQEQLQKHELVQALS